MYTVHIYMGSELFLSFSFSFRWLPPFLPNLSQDKGHRALPFWALVVTAVALRTAAIVVVVVVEGSGYRVQSSGFSSIRNMLEVSFVVSVSVAAAGHL